ncbi:MAG: hypothetical protein H6721_05465 [Sandaracinus sp.]|nr:hypothetical protein [Sandaracinus sp.]
MYRTQKASRVSAAFARRNQLSYEPAGSKRLRFHRVTRSALMEPSMPPSTRLAMTSRVIPGDT